MCEGGFEIDRENFNKASLLGENVASNENSSVSAAKTPVVNSFRHIPSHWRLSAILFPLPSFFRSGFNVVIDT